MSFWQWRNVHWPNAANCAQTSDSDPLYNCIAWAMSDAQHWWEPDAAGENYWPDGVPRNYLLASFQALFESRGYSVCQGNDLEDGYEKVVIFTGTHGRFTHVARQLPTGRWTSKIGDWEDIQHDLNEIEGPTYGSVAIILRRATLSR